MARVERDRTGAISQVMNYVQQQFNDIQKEILDEQDLSGRIDTTYQTGLDASIKTLGRNATKMLIWLIEDHLGLTVPTAYTDAEVDAIDVDIRTFEDGT